MTAADVELVRRVYEMLAADDPVGTIVRGEDRSRLEAHLAEFQHDDAELVPMSILPDPRTVQGTAGLMEFFERLAEVWDEWTMDLAETVDAGEGRVIVLLRVAARGKGSGARVGIEPAHLVTVRDGKVARVEAFLEPAEAFAAAGVER